jgi:hypothetical protein
LTSGAATRSPSHWHCIWRSIISAHPQKSGDNGQPYLGGGNSPDLVVVGAHEDIGDTSTHHADDPLVEVLGLVASDTSADGSIDEAINTLDLVLLGEDGDVVLEGVGNPELLVADVGDTLVGVPVILLGESLVEAVVEVLVVGEDNVATDVVKLSRSQVSR